MKLGSQGTRIGIAVGAYSITAVGRRGTEARVVSAPLIYDGTDPAPVLGTALQDIRARLETALNDRLAGAAVHIALLPPLAETRLLTLPPLRAAEAAAIVRRDAGRYFMGVPAPRLVAVSGRTRGATGAPVMGVAAGAVFVEQLRAAVKEAGWHVLSLTSAHAAWQAAARGSATPQAIVAVDGDTAHIIRLEHGAAVSLRRLPTSAAGEVAGALQETIAATGARVAVYADAPLRDAIARDITTAGFTPTGLNASAAEVAARFAADAALPLMPLTMLAERRDREHRVARSLAVVAAVMIVATAALEMWGARRELAAVRMRRAEIRAEVAPLLTMRDSIGKLDERTAEIETLARATPRWTAAIFDIAMLLPAEAYVTRLSATGDTLLIDAEGARAGSALQALRGAGSLRDARLLGTIERELADGSTTVERFRMSARLAAASTASLARADSALAPRRTATGRTTPETRR